MNIKFACASLRHSVPKGVAVVIDEGVIIADVNDQVVLMEVCAQQFTIRTGSFSQTLPDWKAAKERFVTVCQGINEQGHRRPLRVPGGADLWVTKQQLAVLATQLRPDSKILDDVEELLSRYD